MPMTNHDPQPTITDCVLNCPPDSHGDPDIVPNSCQRPAHPISRHWPSTNPTVENGAGLIGEPKLPVPQATGFQSFGSPAAQLVLLLLAALGVILPLLSTLVPIGTLAFQRAELLDSDVFSGGPESIDQPTTATVSLLHGDFESGLQEPGSLNPTSGRSSLSTSPRRPLIATYAVHAMDTDRPSNGDSVKTADWQTTGSAADYPAQSSSQLRKGGGHVAGTVEPISGVHQEPPTTHSNSTPAPWPFAPSQPRERIARSAAVSQPVPSSSSPALTETSAWLTGQLEVE